MRAKKGASRDGDTAKARHGFYKRLVQLGCTLCKGCNCYMDPNHTCQGSAHLTQAYTPATLVSVELAKIHKEKENAA
jgi:hypothetical protein